MVFLDANILLELILEDRTRVQIVSDYLSTVSETTVISMLSAHLVLHFGRKEKVSDKRLHSLISQTILVDLITEDYAWAVAHERGLDFEDALQLSVALRNGCHTFVTFDAALAKAYAGLPILVVTPQ